MRARAPVDRAWQAFVDYFWAETDPRPYALVRIGFALASLFNWYELFPLRASFFGPNGMIDGSIVRSAIAHQPYFSVFAYARSDLAVTAVFIVALLGMLALFAGAGSRIAAIVVYVFHVSYSHAAFPILHSWDALLRVYAFLLIFSPIGAAWSVDAWLARRRAGAPIAGAPHVRVPVYGLRLMQWQLAVVYVATVWLKVPDASWRNGRLLAYFQMSMYSRLPNVTWLATAEWLSAVLTYASLGIELSVVFLLWSSRLRWVGVILGVGLHVGIAASAHLTVFSLCILAPYAAFLTGADIDYAARWIAKMTPRFSSRSQA